MNQEAVNKDLLQRTSPEQTALLRLYNDNVRLASSKMSEFWSTWDKSYEIYRGYRLRDIEDKRDEQKKIPPQIILPVSFAQVQTAISGLLGYFSQKDRIYELLSWGPEDQTMCEGLERDIDFQIRYNKFYAFLYLYFFDVVTKGIGVGRCSWEVKKGKYRVRREASPGILDTMKSMFGVHVEPQFEEVVEELTQYEGNSISYVSPYSFLPDPSVALKDFQSGSFCGYEQPMSRLAVKNEEGKTFFGTAHIPDAYSSAQDANGQRRHYQGLFGGKKTNNEAANLGEIGIANSFFGQNYSIVEMHLRASPASLLRSLSITDNNWGLDPNDNDERVFVMTVANDTKILRFEECGELHGMFPYFCSQYTPDGDVYIGQGLPETIDGLQTFMTWLMNSHKANVGKSIRNRLIVDPTKVDITDLKNGADYIRKIGTGDIRSAVVPLPFADSTATHMSFLQQLNLMMVAVTGINENALGLYTSGRRSAAQSRGVQQATSQRIGMIANLIWFTGFFDLGRMLLANTRQFRSQDFYTQLLGQDANKYPYNEVILADPSRIAGGVDFAPLEGIDSSNKANLSMLFKELLGNPQVAQMTGLDLNKIMEYMFTINGVKNFDYFKAPPPPTNGVPGGPQVLPDAQVQAMLQQGQLEPLPEGQGGLLEALQ